MKKLAKFAAVVAIIIVVIVVGLVVLAKVVITPELVKKTVLPLAEDALHRKVELGDVSVSLFSGIEMQDLKVYEVDDGEVFVSTDLVRLKYQLLPLLARQVVIDEITVAAPKIRVVRRADGRFSFADMTADQDQAAEATSDGADSGTATPISLLVSQVSVEGGSLVFVDHAVNAGTPHSVEISDLQVAAKGITLTGNVPVSARCKIGPASLNVDGAVSLLNASGEFRIKLDGVDALAFGPYFKDSVPGELEGLKIDLATNVKGSPENISADGTLMLTELDLALDALPDAPLKKARIEVGYDLSVGLESGVLDLRRGHIDFNGMAAEAAGTISELFDRPRLAIRVNIPGIDLKQAMQSVPAGLVAEGRDLDPSGMIKADAELAGGLDDPARLLRKAVVKLDNVQVTANGLRPAIFGTLRLADETLVSEELEMRIGENRASIAMSAGNLSGQTITVKADVLSERFLLDPLLGAGGAAGSVAESVAGKGRTSSARSEEIGPFDIPVRASGTIRIGRTVYEGLTIDDFNAIYELRDNVLTISRLDGKLAGGSFANTARVDLGTRGLAYSADLGIRAIQADPLLSAFIPKAAGALLGAMNLDLNIKGRGTRWQTMSRRLNGTGDMLIADGRVVSPALVEGLSTFLQLSKTDEIRFKNLQGDIRIVDGKVMIDGSLLSDELKLFPKGSIGLDGTMDLSVDTRLSPELAARFDAGGGLTKYLTDQDGWSQVPLLVSGSYASPRFGLDAKGLQRQASDALGMELGRHLDKLFGAPAPAVREEEQGQTGQDSEPAEDPTSKLLQDSLKSLFGN